MNFLAVNYHYIDEEDRYPRGIYPVSPARFRLQLRELGKFFKFVGQREILEALEKKRPLPENCCAITFDDGLKSQYERALPILDEMGIPAIFFINGLPYRERRVLFVHKVHWCRAHLSADEFFSEVRRHYALLSGKPFNFDSFAPVSAAEIEKLYPYDDPEEAHLKFLLNKSSLDLELREKIIDSIFQSLVASEEKFCENFYVSKQQAASLHERFYLGWHGYTHKPIALLDSRAMESEFKNAKRVLLQVTGDSRAKFSAVSFPHTFTVSSEAAQKAKTAGMKFGFTMEKAFNRTLKEPVLFARLDANDISGGKQPLFEIKDGSLQILSPRLRRGREAYFQEI
ncbi:TPA: hypothetical protein DEB04_01125 [Candidatus Giovannonibacteria bacterium]|nr:hypothetical protein [Candidatus Giovannonibacteria bacterium]